MYVEFIKVRVSKVRGWLASLKGQQQQQQTPRQRQHSDNLSSLVSVASTGRVTSPLRLAQVHTPSTVERHHNVWNQHQNRQQQEIGRRDSLHCFVSPPPVPSRNGTMQRNPGIVSQRYSSATTGGTHASNQQQPQDIYESFYDMQRQKNQEIEIYYGTTKYNPAPPPSVTTIPNSHNKKYQIYSV